MYTFIHSFVHAILLYMYTPHQLSQYIYIHIHNQIPIRLVHFNHLSLSLSPSRAEKLFSFSKGDGHE